MKIFKSIKNNQKAESGNKWKGSLYDVLIFFIMVIIVILVLSFIFRYFIECDTVLINNTTDTLTLVADLEHIYDDPKFKPSDKKILLNIKPSDSLKFSHFRKWNSSEILPRYHFAETDVVFFIVKNQKWDVVSIPCDLQKWNYQIIERKHILYLSKIKSKCVFSFNDSLFHDKLNRLEFSDSAKIKEIFSK